MRKITKQDRQCTHNVTLRYVRVKMVTIEGQQCISCTVEVH